MSFFVHERAVCESSSIGEATRIWGFSHVLPGARIGARCNLGEHVFIENRVVIGDGCTIKNGVALWDGVTLENDVFVGPYAVFTNDLRPRAFLKSEVVLRPTIIEQGVTIGANATIVCGITIGRYAFIGAGAVVHRDIPPHGLVLGNPGRLMGKVCYCGQRLVANDFCATCNKVLEEAYDDA